MKSDFLLAREGLSNIGILKVAADFYAMPRKKGNVFFVKSPKSADKHESMALYPGNNRFVDFANGGESGDIIAFLAYVRGSDQWTALQTLRDFYGLTNAREQDQEETLRRILLQQREERQRAERKAAFRAALSWQIADLRGWDYIYRTAIEKGAYEPFSPMWAYCVHELQRKEYKLDVLCGTDIREYSMLKYGNLPSSRPQWLLDCLAILAESGAFTATAGELEEIRAQAAFEARREPGAERGCKIEW